MRVGVHLTNSGGGAVSPDALVDYDTIKKIVVEAELLGYDAVWANEHVTLPTDSTPKETKFFEPLTLLANLAAVTSRIVLGSAVVILPLRDPFVVAKQVTALDVVSGGRFAFGVGVGRFEREYTSHGKAWDKRGEILDEQLRILRPLLSGENMTFAGKHYSCKDFSLSPAPQRAGKIPMVLGGSAGVSLRRAASYCDGIMPGHVSPEQVSELRSKVLGELAKGNKTKRKEPFTFYSENVLSIGDSQRAAESKFQESTYTKKIVYAQHFRENSLVGTPESIRERILEYQKVGLDEFVLIFADENLESFVCSMKLFAEEVLPKIR